MAQLTFVRIQHITNALGRSDYLKKLNRDEKPLRHFESHPEVSWNVIHSFETEHRKSALDNLDGRELIIALPNALADDLDQAERLVEKIALDTLGSNRKFEYSVEWNEAHTDLHAHLLFSDREIATGRTPKLYKKDLFRNRLTGRTCKASDPDAVLVFQKGQVQKNPDGSIKFNEDLLTQKDRKFKEKSWLKKVKTEITDTFKEAGFDIREYDHKLDGAPTVHVGKGNAIAQQERMEYNMQVIEERTKRLHQQMTVDDALHAHSEVSLEDLAWERLYEIRHTDSVNNPLSPDFIAGNARYLAGEPDLRKQILLTAAECRWNEWKAVYNDDAVSFEDNCQTFYEIDAMEEAFVNEAVSTLSDQASQMHQRLKALLKGIIEKVFDLFDVDLSRGDGGYNL